MKQTSALSLRLLIRSLLQENSGEDAPFETFEQIKSRFKHDPVARAYALFGHPERAVLPGAEIDNEYLSDVETAALRLLIVRMEQLFDGMARKHFWGKTASEIYDDVRLKAANETMQAASTVLGRDGKEFDLLEADYNDLISKLDPRLMKELRAFYKHVNSSEFKYYTADAWAEPTGFSDEGDDYVEWSQTTGADDDDV